MAFEAALQDAKAAHLDKQHTDLGEVFKGSLDDLRAAKKAGKLQANRRMRTLWLPKSARLSLGGIKLTPAEALEHGISAQSSDPTGDAQAFCYISDPSDVNKGLAGVWKHVFAEKLADIDIAEEILRRYSSRWDWSLASPPSRESILYFMSKLIDSAPGLDGAIYSCWTACSEAVIVYLCNLLNLFLCQGGLPEGLNDGVFVFPPKPSSSDPSPSPGNVVFKHPTETRPVTLKVFDNKIIAGVINQSINPVIKNSACKIQRGFVQGRQSVQNVVDLDFHSRMHSLDFYDSTYTNAFGKLATALDPHDLDHISNLPVLMLFDFAAAFP